MEIREIDGDLIGALYEAMPERYRDDIRAAMGALMWRWSVELMGGRRAEGEAARVIAWALLTNGGDVSLRDAREAASEAGGMVGSAALLVGAFDAAKTREETRLALADAEAALRDGAPIPGDDGGEDIASYIERLMREGGLGGIEDAG